jgi:hypothetical protein
VIDLNIGGDTSFSASRKLLCSERGSGLDIMFSGKNEVLKKGKRVFIDRNPKIFSLVLDRLRYREDIKEFESKQ